MIRILIVDDFAYIRGLVRTLLEAELGWQVCGEAANGQEAIDQCILLKPTLIILNIHMPVLNGLDAARRILLLFPLMLILILTTDASSNFALAAAASGAYGLLDKARATEDLVVAVSAILHGQQYFLNTNATDTPGQPLLKIH